MRRFKRKLAAAGLLGLLFAGGLIAGARKQFACRASLFFHYLAASEKARDDSGRPIGLRERLVYSFILSTSESNKG